MLHKDTRLGLVSENTTNRGRAASDDTLTTTSTATKPSLADQVRTRRTSLKKTDHLAFGVDYRHTYSYTRVTERRWSVGSLGGLPFCLGWNVLRCPQDRQHPFDLVKLLYIGHGVVHAIYPASLLTSVKEFTPSRMSA